MAKDEKTSENAVVSLQAWKDKKNLKETKTKEPVVIRAKVWVSLKLQETDFELLEKVKKRMGSKIDREVFLRGLNILDQYLELQADGGQLLLITNIDDVDDPVVEFDFE